MDQTTCCKEYCYGNIHRNVQDIEPLINYVYANKDYKVDEMFGGQNLSFSCGDYTLYYECPNVHRTKYFCRLLYVSKICFTDRHNSIVYRLCISVAMFDLARCLHVTFRIAIDVTGQQYTNGISIPLVHLEEVECLELLLNMQDKERFINQTKENILWVYNLLLDNYRQDVYKTQQDCFRKGIYCPLRLISLFNFYYSYRISILNAIVSSCVCKRYISMCRCSVNIYYNRMLVSSMTE